LQLLHGFVLLLQPRLDCFHDGGLEQLSPSAGIMPVKTWARCVCVCVQLSVRRREREREREREEMASIGGSDTCLKQSQRGSPDRHAHVFGDARYTTLTEIER